ncbi:MAG TPA: alpha/beta hydrolase [Rhizomicrobium sp.]|nr:alpha/beta hydrolase [Rhizomicrobium sp.]
MRKVLLAVVFLGIAAAASSTLVGAQTVSYEDVLQQPRPQPTAKIAYGKAPQQFGELYLPAGKPPYLVVVLLHGGCWLAALPSTELMAPMAGDLVKHGYAVWSIAYRRVGEDGGGYPGTFQDTAAAIDMLRTLAPKYHLDLARVVLVGHSAGGHLALWAAARAHLPKDNKLYQPNPLPVAGVVSLAGIDNLKAYRDGGPSACGGPSTIDSLVGPSTPLHRDVYADTSPSNLLPIGVRQVIFSGSLDPIVPAKFGHAYATKAKASGDTVEDVELPGAGHFEQIDPQSKAWPRILQAIQSLSSRTQ